MSSSLALNFVTVNGIKLRYADVGTGPAVLLLHGWPELWYSWRHQITSLSHAGYRVIAPDLRGYGGSDCPVQSSAYDSLAVSQDILGMLQSLQITKAAIVGHDWGALITYFWRSTVRKRSLQCLVSLSRTSCLKKRLDLC